MTITDRHNKGELVTTQRHPAYRDFKPGHHVEEHVKVYLRLSDDGTHWEIDPINFDGFPLDGLKNGPTPSESACWCKDRQECWQAHNHAAYNVPLPTGAQLVAMLYESEG